MKELFQPLAGQVALVEYVEGSRSCLTGLVLPGAEHHVTIDLGAAGPLRGPSEDVVVSVFAADALYRLEATAMATDLDGVIVLDPIRSTERVQRRTTPRVPIRVGMVISTHDGPGMVTIAARSLDIGPGGMRVETLRALPEGQPVVALTLPDGSELLAQAQILDADGDEEGYEYRLAFVDLSPDAEKALISLVEQYPKSRH
ncbi:MAG: PilZ domain-containing protein [Actinobacteria bacterium]|nr:PilZ domain-containing protein [Actinomycetota bacterium]